MTDALIEKLQKLKSLSPIQTYFYQGWNQCLNKVIEIVQKHEGEKHYNQYGEILAKNELPMRDADIREDAGRKSVASITSPTNQTLNDCREVYEAWCIREKWSFDKDPHIGHYLHPASGRWAAWQEAWNIQRREILGNEFLVEKQIPRCLEIIEKHWPPEEHAENEDAEMLWSTLDDCRELLSKPKREISHCNCQENCPMCNAETTVSYWKGWHRHYSCKGCGFRDTGGILGEPPCKTEIEGQKP